MLPFFRRSCIAAFAGIAACFDVSRVPTDSAPFIWPQLRKVDSFENDEMGTDWSLLSPPECLHWPDGDLPQCGRVEPGVDGAGHAQYLDFDVTSRSPDDFQNVALLFSRSATRLDLGGYDRIVFRTRFTAKESGSLPDDLELRVDFVCPSLNEEISDGVSVQSAVRPAVDGSWQTFAIDLRDLTQPFWQEQEGERIDRNLCLGKVEDLQFVLASDSIENTAKRRMAGRFELDDVELQIFGRGEPPSPDPAQLSAWNCALILSDEAADGLANTVDCDGTPSEQSMTFALDSRQEEQTALLRSWLYEVDSVSHEQLITIQDWSSFRALSFEAQFIPAETSERTGRAFDVAIGCDNLLPGSFVSVGRGFEVSPEWSSYTLSLSSFEPPDYPIGFSDVQRCIAHAQGLIFAPDVKLGEVGAGTFHIRALMLR
jgi:hypothetical protein